MKKIILSDTSRYECISSSNSPSKYNFKLNYANTLLDSEPYYYKYGFIYLSKDDNDKVINNKHVLENILLEDIDFEIIKNIIINETTKKIKDVDNTLKIIEKMYNIYLKQNITIFLKNIKYKSCKLFSLIYGNI